MSKVRVVALLAVLAATMMTGIAAAGVLGRPLVGDQRIGPLRIDKSRAAAIIRFAGLPKRGGRFALQYDCVRQGCYINYLLRTRGRLRGKLVAAVLSRGPFATASGIVIGMTRAEALQRDPALIPASFCGERVLRDLPLSTERINHWVGLNITVLKGKVRGFIIFSSHVKVTCMRHNQGFNVWN
jgi:hypothetical protein